MTRIGCFWWLSKPIWSGALRRWSDFIFNLTCYSTRWEASDTFHYSSRISRMVSSHLLDGVLFSRCLSSLSYGVVPFSSSCKILVCNVQHDDFFFIVLVSAGHVPSIVWCAAGGTIFCTGDSVGRVHGEGRAHVLSYLYWLHWNISQYQIKWLAPFDALNFRCRHHLRARAAQGGTCCTVNKPGPFLCTGTDESIPCQNVKWFDSFIGLDFV